MTRIALLASTCLFGSVVAASAADLYTPPPVEPGVTYAPASFNWTGFYIGAHGGYGGDRFDYPLYIAEELVELFIDDVDDDITGQADITSSGFFAGGQIGANWQFAPQWVAGVEADASWSDIKGELGASVDAIDGFDGVDIELGSQINWFSTIRGRLGFLPAPRLMLYGTGGLAVGETEAYAKGSGEFDFDISEKETNWGWTAGAGFEYAITNNITFKTEYLYVDLGSMELLNFEDAATLDADSHFHSIKAGFNVLFGNGGSSGGSGADFAYADDTAPMSWTGFYIGAHGGFGGDRFEYPLFLAEELVESFLQEDISDDITGQADLTSSGFFAGGQVGANWQFAPQWVAGIEADASWSDIKGEVGVEIDPCCGGFPGASIELGSQINWMATLRGRLGFLPTDRLLVYGTGGLAVGETEAYVSGDGILTGLDDSASETNVGWTAGGGFEYAVTNNVTLKTEYLYTDLGSMELLNFEDAATLDVDSHVHTIKAGINVLFN